VEGWVGEAGTQDPSVAPSGKLIYATPDPTRPALFVISSFRIITSVIEAKFDGIYK
jgi:hypothetical protein